MLLLFTLGRPDVPSLGDYGVRKGAQALYGLAELPDRGALEGLGERWRPFRSRAACTCGGPPKVRPRPAEPAAPRLAGVQPAQPRAGRGRANRARPRALRQDPG